MQRHKLLLLTCIIVLAKQVFLSYSKEKHSNYRVCAPLSLTMHLVSFSLFFSPLRPVISVLCLDVMGDGREEKAAGEGRSIRKQGEQGEQGEERREGG